MSDLSAKESSQYASALFIVHTEKWNLVIVVK